MSPDVLSLTRELVAVDTIDHDENHALAVVAPHLEDAGFDVRTVEHEPGRGTLIAEWHADATAPPLCLSGHVDTVPLGGADWSRDPFRAEPDGDRLYGRGTTDMKGGVAAIVCAAVGVATSTRAPRAGLRLVLTAAEETGSHGARGALDALRGRPSGPLLIAEPTSNAVFHGHKGALWLSARAEGVTAHGSMPHLGDNAVYKLARAVGTFEGFAFTEQAHPAMGAPTLNVGTFHGGLNTNSVPDSAVATVDIRTVPGQDHAAITDDLQARVGDDASVGPLVDLPAVWTDPADDWAAAVSAIAADVTGASQGGEPRAATYFTDASVLTPALGGVPTVVCGPGEPELAHVTDEWVSIAKLRESEEIIRRVATQWCET
ncbi:succinyl-diaminopimelate desuccinylase [Prauserella isguenensis]|uniref:Succinyl-diaminopimelate desuccinylase n=1 Tax=Prauserella isguenensis TaxID=1470180 RepID=A0A839RWS4_9PSEU|nr:M20 family metallopeptidase [Prauserella isguenensis]MBB3049290.1 succinyl-diaminopimelate desuccinylase [Prauserella isguenensis]